jgi:ribonuclease E
MKDALRNDRARVQIGRISAFGLMEMSRQRLRTGILEASTHICPMCEGTGMVRSVSSAALAALRALEAEALRGRASEFTLRAGDEVAVYILNRKRIELAELEELYGVTIVTVPDESLIGPNFAIDATGAPPTKKVEMRALPAPVRIEDDPDDLDDAGDDDDGEARPHAERGERGERGGRNKRRRRGGRGKPGDDAPAGSAEGGDAPIEDGEPDTIEVVAREGETSAETEARGDRERGERKRRRRGRRGKRDGAASDAAPAVIEAEPALEAAPADADAKPKRPRRRKPADTESVPDAPVAVVETAPEPAPVAAAAPAKGPRKRPSKAKPAAPAAAAEPVVEPAAATIAEDAPAAKPKRAPRKAKAAEPEAAIAAPAAEAAEAGDEAPAGPLRKGWWQRTFG